MLSLEVEHRQNSELQRKTRLAAIPHNVDLEKYDYTFDNGVSKKEIDQLKEFVWLEQNYNVILMGPSGTGKTFIAGGLVSQAVKAGYRAYFKTMEDLLQIIKMRNITASAMMKYNQIAKCHLLAIDDVMLLPMGKQSAVDLFNLINLLHEKASIIITTNKSPTEWAQSLDDEVLTAAILDRLLYRCQVVKLSGKSFRMQNRKEIFNKESSAGTAEN
jgi:DNA replication protein DnaC